MDLERIALRAQADVEQQVTAAPGDRDEFVTREWRERATTSRRAIDAIVAAFGPEAEGLTLRFAADLAIDWPAERVVVDVVTTSPPLGAEELVPPHLAALGRCFARRRGDDDKVHSARIIDCVLAYAARPLASRSAIGVELGKLLPPERAARAWDLLVIHAAAATVAAWAPEHEPVLRRSAAAVERGALAWLADNWGSRARGESPASFAARYASALQAEPDRSRTEP